MGEEKDGKREVWDKEGWEKGMMREERWEKGRMGDERKGRMREGKQGRRHGREKEMTGERVWMVRREG